MHSKEDQLQKNGTFREKDNRDKVYTEMLHLVPCVICNTLPVETHHVYGRKFGTDDHRQLPFCIEHHRGTMGIHNMGNVSFQKHFNINVYKMAEEYYTYYENKTKEKNCKNLFYSH